MCGAVVLICVLLLYSVTATPHTYTLSLHDALPIFAPVVRAVLSSVGASLPRRLPVLLARGRAIRTGRRRGSDRSEEHTSELQSRQNLVCRLLIAKKKPKSR